MAELSDDQLRAELKLLSGKDAGPVMASTRPAMVKKLMRLRESTITTTSSTNKSKAQSKIASSTGSTAVTHISITSSASATKSKLGSNAFPKQFGFSSDEETGSGSETRQRKVSSTSKSKPDSKRRSLTTRRSVTSVDTKEISAQDSGAAGVSTSVSHLAANGGAKIKIPTEHQLKLLSNDEIQSKLFELTGDRFPVTDATKSLHIRKLRRLLANDDASFRKDLAMDVLEPNETQFSDTDEEAMDFEPSPDVPTNSASYSFKRPQLVNQAVNTSSFLDVTTPGDRSVSDVDSDCNALPSSSMDADPYNDSDNDDVQITSTHSGNGSHNLTDIPSRLPSPNLSSTRRSFLPSSAVLKPKDVPVPRPVPPSPPRSAYARRPLRTPAKFLPLNAEASPKPSRRFSSTFSSTVVNSHPSQPDFATRYNTDGGRVLSTPPSKRAKVAKDVDMMIRDKGKSLSYLYSRALVIGLIIFVAALFSFYIYLRLTAPIPLEHVFQPDDNYWSLVKKSEGSLGECKVTEGCYTETELRESKAVVEILGTYLSQHAGKYECNWSGYEERRVASTVARMAIMKLHGNGVQILWKPVLNLLIKNPRWKINVIGEDGKAAQNVNEIWWVESVEAIKPWTCTVANAMSRIITVVVAVFVVGLLGYLAFLYGSYRKRQLQQQDNLFYDLLENTVELLESQHVLSRDDPKEQAYLAIRHVHDTLINPPDRQSMKGVWDRVVKHMKENESRVREEVQQVQGEEHLVWRWLQSTDSKGAARDDGTSRWVGSALRDATRLKLNFTPKQCLKIRGMFDIYKETGTNWPQRIRDDILERLGPDHGVVHLEVDTQSEENRVYMKLGRKKHAGKAYQLLNGAYYGGTGDCVQCKFIELDKYHQKFPLAGSDTAALTQSPPGRSPNLYPSLSRYQ